MNGDFVFIEFSTMMADAVNKTIIVANVHLFFLVIASLITLISLVLLV